MQEAAKVEGRDDCVDSHFPMSDEPCGSVRRSWTGLGALVTFGTAIARATPRGPDAPVCASMAAFATREEAREHAEIRPVCGRFLLHNCRSHARVDSHATDGSDVTIRRAAAAAMRALLREEHRGRQADLDMVAEKSFREARPVECPDPELEEAEALVYKPPRKMRSGAEVGASLSWPCVSTRPHGRMPGQHARLF